MPERYEFEFGLSRTKGRRTRRDVRKRMLVIGDFSGAAGQRAPLEERPLPQVDIDNLDALIKRIGPRLDLPAGMLAFTQLDDFGPDRLFADMEVFQSLRQARANPGAGHDELLGRLLGSPAGQATATTRPLPAAGLDALIRDIVAPHVVRDTSAQTRGVLTAIDSAATEQMRQVMHDPAFRALESAWRGVHWLVANLDLDEHLALHLLDVSHQELLDDIATAQGDLLRSGLYNRLCGPAASAAQEPGWSLLVGLSGFGPGAEDLQLLAAMGAVASQVGGAFVAAAKPTLVGCSAVVDMPDPARWTPPAGQAAQNWAALRTSAFAPSIGLVAPRVLLRLPYGKATDPTTLFAFEEQGPAPDHETLLWGPGSLALALMVGQSLSSGESDTEPDSVTELTDLPAYTFFRGDQAELQPCAEVLMGESAGLALLERGVMPLLSHRQRAAVRLMRLQSIAEPPCALQIGQG